MVSRSALLFSSVVSLGPVAVTQLPPTLAERYDLENPSARLSLPHHLDEVSGLAVTDDGRVFAHGDEHAAIYELDPAEGKILKRFSLGVPVLPGDFEGIAVADERFFLISSQGLLLEFREGADEESVPFRGVDTGLMSRCEVEGLAFEPAAQTLLAACKTVPSRDRGFIVLYRIRLSNFSVEAEAIRVPLVDLEAVGLAPRFSPSGVEADPDTGMLILTSAREEAILEITSSGEVVAGFRFGSRRHPQVEGIGFLPDGTLLLSDERQSNRAHITAYSRRLAPPRNALGLRLSYQAPFPMPPSVEHSYCQREQACGAQSHLTILFQAGGLRVRSCQFRGQEGAQ